jgi:hypothetical protein
MISTEPPNHRPGETPPRTRVARIEIRITNHFLLWSHGILAAGCASKIDAVAWIHGRIGGCSKISSGFSGTTKDSF